MHPPSADADHAPPAACLAKYAYLSNELNQDPCEVAQILYSLELPERPYVIEGLAPGKTYPPLSKPQGSRVTCSVQFYNLLDTCAECQHTLNTTVSMAKFTDFTAACPTAYTGAFPVAVPDTTCIPDWANTNDPTLLNHIISAHNNASATPTTTWLTSYDSRGSPTRYVSTATTTITDSAYASTVTDSLASAATDGPSSNEHAGPAPDEASHGKRPVVLAASLAGCFFFGIIVAVLVMWYVRRKRRAAMGRVRLPSTETLEKNEKDDAFDGGYVYPARDLGYARSSFYGTNSISSGGDAFYARPALSRISSRASYDSRASYRPRSSFDSDSDSRSFMSRSSNASHTSQTDFMLQMGVPLDLAKPARTKAALRKVVHERDTDGRSLYAPSVASSASDASSFDARDPFRDGRDTRGSIDQDPFRFSEDVEFAVQKAMRSRPRSIAYSLVSIDSVPSSTGAVYADERVKGE